MRGSSQRGAIWRCMMIVGVMALGNESLAKEHDTLANEVGCTIAEQGFHL